MTFLRNGTQRGNPRHARSTDRRGAVLVLSAILMVVLLAMVAFAIDLGYMMKVQTDLDRAVDAAVLAGAGVLVNGQEQAEDQMFEFLARNPVGPQITVDDGNLDEIINWYKSRVGQTLMDEHGNVVRDQYGNPIKLVDLSVGRWDPTGGSDGTGGVDPNNADGTPVDKPSVIGLSVVQDQQPFFFAKVFGKTTFAVRSEAVAMYQPRDIMVVLDFSGSMSYDSQLKSIPTLGSTTVINNLQEIYQDLGSPTHGNLQFTPVYISSTNNTTIKNTLGISNVAYPYPSGSWDEFINYVKSSSEQPAKAGYRYKYGYLTLINYWLEKKNAYSETPDLWKVRAQPVHALKQAADYFFDYLEEVDADDRAGLAIYNGPGGYGILEHALTDDFETLRTIITHRQAAHYHDYTNIAGGMRKARLQLRTEQNGGAARTNAYRMMVLMTDGRANWTDSGGYSIPNGKADVLAEASLCVQEKIPVVTISLGALADTSLMQQVADMTGGVHFNIPGGKTGAEYEEELTEVFHAIADSRPLRLVK